MLMIHQVNKKWVCNVCEKPIPRGSICLADDEVRGYKVCIACSEKALENKISNLKGILKARVKHMENLKRKIMRNKEQYNNQNAVAVLGDFDDNKRVEKMRWMIRMINRVEREIAKVSEARGNKNPRTIKIRRSIRELKRARRSLRGAV